MTRILCNDVARVDNLRDPHKPWRLMWRTVVMPAPSFWYYATEAEAVRMRDIMRGYDD